jgi:hypothetical protein
MRAIRINPDRTVEEIDEDAFDWMGDEVEWDCVTLPDGHDIWVRDDGLFEAECVAMVAGRALPLPAFIAGSDGERTTAATMTVDEARALLA